MNTQWLRAPCSEAALRAAVDMPGSLHAPGGGLHGAEGGIGDTDVQCCGVRHPGWGPWSTEVEEGQHPWDLM